MESGENQDSNDIRCVCCSTMRYIVLAVERRVADSHGVVTISTAHSSSLRSQFPHNTPVVSNVSKSSHGEKLERQKPKFINMPMSENEVAEKKGGNF